MAITRRECLSAAAATAAWGLAANMARAGDGEKPKGLRVGMCDWSLRRQDVSVFELAKEIGLDGVQVSVGRQDEMFLRDPKMQEQYLEASKKTGVAIASTGMPFLNQIPLMSEPRTAIWALDTIDITRKLGADIILLAFFQKGELKEENKEDMRRVTEVLAELAPRAEKAGVVLGLENYLSAQGSLGIIEKAKSPAVQVYYDVYNSWVTKGYEPVKDIHLMGGPRICQVHVKEGRDFLGGSGKIDWPAVARALKEVDYRGWIILETSSPSGDVVKDARINLEYVRKVFAPLA
jgi:sugar phosphate isomerase/epimerase